MTQENEALPAPYLQLLDILQEQWRDTIVNEGRQLQPAAFLICPRANQAGAYDVIAALGEFTTNEAKDYFAETVKQLASKHQPEAIVFVSEGWAPPRRHYSDEEMKAYRAKYKQIADDPERRDVLMVMVETTEGNWMGNVELGSTPEGRRTMGTLELHKMAGAGGRFGHLLQVKYLTPDEVTAKVAQARALFVEQGVDPDYRHQSGQTLMEQITAFIRQAPAKNVNDESLQKMAEGLGMAYHLLVKGDHSRAPHPVIDKVMAELKRRNLEFPGLAEGKLAMMLRLALMSSKMPLDQIKDDDISFIASSVAKRLGGRTGGGQS